MSEIQNTGQDGLAEDDDENGMSISEMFGVLREHLKLLAIAPLRLAAGPTKGADEGSIFVVRANGNVVSSMEGGNWFNRRGALKDRQAGPGDTIFGPEEMRKTTTTQVAKDRSQIFLQIAVGFAGLKSSTWF